jgi:hypothetical protein
MFSVFDEKSQAYLNPFFMQNEAQAIRAMMDIMHDQNHSFFRFASDYTLYQIAEWDNVSSELDYDLKLISPLLVYRSAILASAEKLPLFDKEQ